MKYPRLIKEKDCKTKIHVVIDKEGISEDGEPMKAFEADLMCNYQDSAKTILTDEKKLVQISGTALFPGDIDPDLPELSGGRVNVFGVERQIIRGMKARNPDGTVNYTRLDVQ